MLDGVISLYHSGDGRSVDWNAVVANVAGTSTSQYMRTSKKVQNISNQIVNAGATLELWTYLSIALSHLPIEMNEVFFR